MNQSTATNAGFAINSIWFAAEPPGSWTALANCRSYPNDAVFFTEVRSFDEANLALSICAACPVQTACLAYGRQLQADGVWGGRLLHHGAVVPQPVQRPARHRPAP